MKIEIKIFNPKYLAAVYTIIRFLATFLATKTSNLGLLEGHSQDDARAILNSLSFLHWPFQKDSLYPTNIRNDNAILFQGLINLFDFNDRRLHHWVLDYLTKVIKFNIWIAIIYQK